MSNNRSDGRVSKAERDARRAAALRANLQRRKAQSRARADTATDAEDTERDRDDEQKGRD